MFTVYAIVNLINGKMYVGSTIRSLKIRLQRHVAEANADSQCSLHKAIRKYNSENFIIRMIAEYSDRTEMLNGEIDWIEYLDTFKSRHGYNDTVGGDGGDTNGGKKFSPEWVDRISKSLAGKSLKLNRRFDESVERQMCQLYLQNYSTYALGLRFDCSRSLVISILNRWKITRRKSNYTGHSNGRNIFTPEQELEICQSYSDGLTNISHLAKKFKCGTTTAREILIRHNYKPQK